MPILELASGGMGTVSICIRRSGAFERMYAVKRLHPHLRDDPTMRAMFLDEARMSGLLRHGNVVPVLDVGEDESGPFLVMDYVEGLSVSRFIREHAGRGEQIPVALCLHIVAQTARGLHAAHELLDSDGHPLHLVHRDVSPQNILVARDGVVRVTDFGVAKALGRSTHTSTGLLKGKVGYMSPEQLRFEPLDRRCDLFALGVVLAELITTSRVFAGRDSATVARRVLEDPPPDLGDLRPGLSPTVVELAFTLLAKQPDHRPDTAADVAAILDEALAMEGPIDLGGYVEARFGDELDRIRAEVRRAAAQQAPAKTNRSTVPSAPSGRGRASAGVAWATAGVGAVALLGGMWWWSRRPQPSMPAAPSSAAAPSQTVDVFVDSRPTGARVRIDNRSVGHTPLRVELPRGDQAVELVLERDGFVDASESLVPNRSARLLIALTADAAKPPPSAAAPPSPTAAKPAQPNSAPAPSLQAKPRSKARQSVKKRPKPPPESKAKPPKFRRFD